MIEVFLLDDHEMVLKGLESMLKGNKELQISKTFSKGKELMEHLKVHHPDVLLLDINLPDSNGIDLCKAISKLYPEIRTIGLSNYSETGFIKNMMRNGARGYLLKNTTREELIKAITRVYAGETYIPMSLNQRILDESFGKQSSDAFIPKLTRRENEVLQCISQELTNHEIGEKLFISTKTVESHRNNLLQKFGVRNTAGLVKAAFTKGLLE
jgi:DNA-binding NarL/FixJ family response regulator